MSPEMHKLIIALTDSVGSYESARAAKAPRNVMNTLTENVKASTVALATAIEYLEANQRPGLKEPAEFKLVKSPEGSL